MSRAFVSEDGPTGPAPRFRLPPREDPTFDRRAAEVLLAAADAGETAAAEEATGYAFGAPALVPHVRLLLADAEARGREREAQLAERFLRRAGVVLDDDA